MEINLYQQIYINLIISNYKILDYLFFKNTKHKFQRLPNKLQNPKHKFCVFLICVLFGNLCVPVLCDSSTTDFIHTIKITMILLGFLTILYKNNAKNHWLFIPFIVICIQYLGSPYRTFSFIKAMIFRNGVCGAKPLYYAK